MNGLAEVLQMNPIPVVATDPNELEFIDAAPARLSIGKFTALNIVQRVAGDVKVLTPPVDSDVIASGSATLTIAATVDDDLAGLIFEFQANFNVSPTIMEISIASFDKRGTATTQTIKLRPKANSGRAVILFATASDDIAVNYIIHNGQIETLTTGPTFASTAITFTVTCSANGATVSIVGINQKHEEFLGLSRMVG